MVSTLPSRTQLFLFVLATGLIPLCSPAGIFAQGTAPSETLEAVTPARAWDMKVVWEDIRGERHRTKGWLLIVTGNALILSVETGPGRAKQQRIHASNIVKIKYKVRGESALPDVASGALQGALSGGYVPIQTGNLGLDLLAGAVQGALGGLFQGNSYSRRIYVDQRPDIFRNYVYPDLVAGR